MDTGLYLYNIINCDYSPIPQLQRQLIQTATEGMIVIDVEP